MEKECMDMIMEIIGLSEEHEDNQVLFINACFYFIIFELIGGEVTERDVDGLFKHFRTEFDIKKRELEDL